MDDNYEDFFDACTVVDKDGNLLNAGADPESMVVFITVGIASGEQYVPPPSLPTVAVNVHNIDSARSAEDLGSESA